MPENLSKARWFVSDGLNDIQDDMSKDDKSDIRAVNDAERSQNLFVFFTTLSYDLVASSRSPGNGAVDETVTDAGDGDNEGNTDIGEDESYVIIVVKDERNRQNRSNNPRCNAWHNTAGRGDDVSGSERVDADGDELVDRHQEDAQSRCIHRYRNSKMYEAMSSLKE